MTTKTQEIKDIMQSVDSDMISADGKGDAIENPNHWARRCFRLWLDGSYKGYEHYCHNLKYFDENRDDEKRLRSFVIHAFTSMMALECDCSYGHAQKSIVASMPKAWLEKLNKALIDDARDVLERD